MATRVSWGFAEITISFDMKTPQWASDGGGHAEGESERTGSASMARRTILLCP